MIVYIDICQRTQQYKLPGCITWENYSGLSLDELSDKLINEHNAKIQDLIKHHPSAKWERIVFIEMENDFCGIIV